MKKLGLITAIVGLVSISYGQGFVNFVNSTAATPVATNSVLDIYGNTYAGPNSGGTGIEFKKAATTTYYFTLLMLPYTSGPSNGAVTASSFLGENWLWTGIYGTNGIGNGSLSGSAAKATVQNDTIGAGNQFIVVGWSANLNTAAGPNWMAVSNELATASWANPAGTAGFLGFSMTGTGVGAAAAPATAELLFGVSPTITSGFTLYAVPEPATLTLAGLAGISLLLFRRRK